MYKKITFGFSVVLIVLGVIDFNLPAGFWLKDYVRGTFTETVGIIITLIFVNYLFEKKEEQERKAFVYLFLKQLKPPLVRQLILFYQMHKSVKLDKFKPQAPKDYVEQQFLTDMELFDFSKSAPVYPACYWYQHAVEEMIKFGKDLSLLVDRYVIYIDKGTVEAVEKVRISNLTTFINTLPHVFQAYNQNKNHWEKNGVKPSFNFFGDNGLFGKKEVHKQDHELKKYLVDLVALIEMVNKELLPEEQITGPQEEPILAEGILQLKRAEA